MNTRIKLRNAMLSALVGILALAQTVRGQAELRYYVFDETKTGTLHYEHVHDFTVYHWEKGKPQLHFHTKYRIYGLALTNFSYTVETVSGELDLKKYQRLLAQIREIDLSTLAVAPTGQVSGVSGWVDVEGKQYDVRVPLAHAQRRTLHGLLMSFLEDVRPHIKSEKLSHVIQGELTTPVDVSLSDIVKRPSEFDGKRVRVRGFHHSEFEHSSLSEGPNGIRTYEESVWLGGPSTFTDAKAVVSKNDSFMTVEGTYVAGRGGHMGLWCGEIERLTRIAVEDKK